MPYTLEQQIEIAAEAAAQVALAPITYAARGAGIVGGGVVSGTGKAFGEGLGGFAEGMGRGAGSAPGDTVLGWGVILTGLAIAGSLAWILHRPVSRAARSFGGGGGYY